MIYRSLLWFIILFVMSHLTFAAKQHFIIDTDAASDDAIAILYLLQQPNIAVDAITIVGTGEVPCKPALYNIHALLKLANQSHIPIACGRELPLKGQHHFPDFLTKDQATLSNTNHLLPRVRADKPTLSAIDLFIHTLHASSHPVTLLTLGPLTNIAEALQKSPEIKHRIQAIFIMGGAVL